MASSQQYAPISYDAPPSDDDSIRGSSESARHDHEILQDEEESQRDLLRAGKLNKDPTGVQGKKRGIFTRLRESRTGPADDAQNEGLLQNRAFDERADGRHSYDKKESLHEVEREEGGFLSPASYSDRSSDMDREKMRAVAEHKKTPKGRRICGITVLHAVIAALFVSIAYGAYAATMSSRSSINESAMTSNGTSSFGPTTLLISLDGFRADFLQKERTPALHALMKEGTSPEYMTPSFPSLTFPNHYTLVTGLYPEKHGIVANTFYDKEFQEGFVYQEAEHSMQPKWWAPNPIWETAEHQGVRTAIHMWPGSEAHIGDLEPTHIDKYNGSEVLSRKVDRIFELLDKPGLEDSGASTTDPRPQFIAAYVPNVDSAGHKYGPNSTEITESIEAVDGMIKSIVSGISDRNLTSIVNIVVVSDHGMATTSNERLIQLEDLIDPDLFSSMDGWPHYGLRPKKPSDLKAIHSKLSEKAKDTEGFDVYLRDEDMPERYHFTHNDRIAPLWLMPHTGWAIVTKDEYDVEQGKKDNKPYKPAGIHGYDNEDPLMRAIFIARGPAFPHPAGSRLEPFQNTQVYNILCDSIGIEPAENNGTMRLPLKPVGVHGDGVVVHDKPGQTAANSGNNITTFVSNHTHAANGTTHKPNNNNNNNNNNTKPAISVDEPAIDGDSRSRPTIDDTSQRTQTAKERIKHFVDILREKWKGFVVWVGGKKVKPSDDGEERHGGDGKDNKDKGGSPDGAGEKSADGKNSADGKSEKGEGEDGAVTAAAQVGDGLSRPESHTEWMAKHTFNGAKEKEKEEGNESESEKDKEVEEGSQPKGKGKGHTAEGIENASGGHTFFAGNEEKVDVEKEGKDPRPEQQPGS